jgi:hypothetical protein
MDAIDGRTVNPKKLPFGLSKDLLAEVGVSVLQAAGDSGSAQTLRGVSNFVEGAENASFLGLS